MSKLNPPLDSQSLLNRTLYKDIYYSKDNSIKINSSNNKNIKIPPPKYIYKDRRQIKLSDQAIKEFQDLHEAKFGYRPNKEEAETDLFKLMRAVVLIQPHMHGLKRLEPINVKKNKL